MGMTDGKHLDIEDQPARKSGRNLGDKKCVHRLAARGPGNMVWCELHNREAFCGSCKILAQMMGRSHRLFRRDQVQAEDRCHRRGVPVKIHHLHTGGTLRDAVGSKTDGPVFTKHHETVMPRSKVEKMKQYMDIYGGVTPYEKYIQKLKIAEDRSRMQRWVCGWWTNDVTIAMQERAAHADYSKIEARLLSRAGVTLVHDEFLIDDNRWVSPFTEGELVTYKGGLVRVLKITGPVVKVKYQQRHSAGHFNVMDWELEKRSIIKWVVKLVRKLWQVG